MRSLLALLLVSVLCSGVSAQELKLGLIPEQNVFKQMRRYEPLGSYLERKTGFPVRFTVLSRYGNIIENFEKGEMDGAFLGSFTGALAIRKLGVQPVARPVWRDGSSTYHGYMFVRRESGLESVEEMRGKTVVFVDRATTAGYVFPIAYFHRNGVEDVDDFFGESYFAGSHDAAVHAVLDGSADIGCAKNTIYRMMEAEHPEMEQALLILARSPDVPSNGLALRPSVPEGTREALKKALIGMAENSEGRRVLESFGALRFEETTVGHYSPVFRLAEDAGIDLSTYHYRNE